ncbi:MAG: acetolactate synthase small subunit [Acholeplasmatales bacterium]|nr:acetolactate synthase small subunit [Acholeplasmatales bacterium]
MAKHTLSVLVNNHMGVLSRVSGLFSRRGFSIESLSSGTTENKKVARMTIVVDCDTIEFNQIKNQLAKLMDVVAISESRDDDSVMRELALIKIDCRSDKRSQIMEIVNIFRAHVVDVTNSSMILEITGDKSKITALISMLDEFGIKEVIRTGVTAIARGESELKNNALD